MQNVFRKQSVFFSLAFALLCSLTLLLAGVAVSEEAADAAKEAANAAKEAVGAAQETVDTAQDILYTVHFFSWDNSVLHTEQVNAGDPVSMPDVVPPEREYHNFSYWYDVRGDRSIPYDFSQPVETTMTLKAFYTIKPDLKAGDRAVVVYKDFGTVVTNGEQITVIGELIGFEGCNVFLQWQYLDENKKWVNIDGANGLTYQFEATRETINRDYRLGVTVLN